MHEHYGVVRWAGGLHLQTSGQMVDAYPTAGRADQDPLEAAFEQDLATWLGHLETVRVDRRIRRVCVIGWLSVMASILAIPLVGIGAALVAVGALVATLVGVWKAAGCGTEEVEIIRGTGPPASHAQAHPPFGPDERARLVRIMNLSRARRCAAARQLLHAELLEAWAREPLAHWKPLLDLEELLSTDGSVFRVISE